MAALPKRRISTRRQGKRRADPRNKLKLPKIIKCSHCQQPKLPHVLCPNCQKY